MGNTIKNWEKQRRREEKQMQQEIQTEVMGYFMSKLVEAAAPEGLSGAIKKMRETGMTMSTTRQQVTEHGT